VVVVNVSVSNVAVDWQERRISEMTYHESKGC